MKKMPLAKLYKTPRRSAILPLALAALVAAPCANALEYPVGRPQIRDGMEVSAVYLQPVAMQPAGMMRSLRDSDIHLEADIRAQADNANGFADGAWIPYLDIRYELVRQGSAQPLQGALMPMVASDGPHYGDNVKLQEPGRYRLKLTIAPPGASGHFGRHTDRETGVGPWFKPFSLEYDFTYTGLGKKGGY